MKKWTEEELDLIINKIEDGKSYEEIGNILNRSSNSVRSKLNKIGKKYSMFKQKEKSICLNCNETINNKDRKFCSKSCSATFNNSKRKKQNKCLNCNSIINIKNKYCSNKCQRDFEKFLKFKSIELGNKDLYEKNYKDYLIEKYGEKCMECGWDKVHSITGKVPIQLEHINGDSSDNTLSNLKLLCPNCHSLTITYGALNKGNGRKNRKR